MTTDFTVHFGGDSHEIDLNTLITSLVNFSAAIQEIQSAVAPEANVDIKVRAPQRGSFLIDLMLSAPDVMAQTRSLFSKENLSVVENILSIFANTLNLKNHLKGEEPKALIPSFDGQTVSVENIQGNVMIFNNSVVNLYANNPKIESLISSGFAAISRDENVESVKITDSNGIDLALIEESEFATMATLGAVPVAPTKRKVMFKNVNLRAFRISFEGNVKWGFVFRGEKIQAAIKDPMFYKRIEKNEPFAKGDMFVVDLEVTQEYDASVQDFLNKSFEVALVTEHRKADIQGELFE